MCVGVARRKHTANNKASFAALAAPTDLPQAKPRPRFPEGVWAQKNLLSEEGRSSECVPFVVRNTEGLGDLLSEEDPGLLFLV